VAEAREVTDRMFRRAAECLAQQVPEEDLAAGALYPRVRDLRRVSTRIAEAVAREARDSGMGKARSDEAISRAVREAQWEPVYQPFV
jgi:malic enzyme